MKGEWDSSGMTIVRVRDLVPVRGCFTWRDRRETATMQAFKEVPVSTDRCDDKDMPHQGIFQNWWHTSLDYFVLVAKKTTKKKGSNPMFNADINEYAFATIKKSQDNVPVFFRDSHKTKEGMWKKYKQIYHPKVASCSKTKREWKTKKSIAWLKWQDHDFDENGYTTVKLEDLKPEPGCISQADYNFFKKNGILRSFEVDGLEMKVDTSKCFQMNRELANGGFWKTNWKSMWVVIENSEVHREMFELANFATYKGKKVLFRFSLYGRSDKSAEPVMTDGSAKRIFDTKIYIDKACGFKDDAN